MSKLLKKLLVEDWVVVMLSIPLLVLCYFANYLPSISIPTNMLEAGAWGKIGMLALIALVALFAGNKLLSRPIKGMLLSFIVVFAIAALAMVIGSNKFIKSDLGLEPVFFSVIFGLIIRNAFHVPEWMKPAIQGEFYIKIGVVCLGATIMIGDVMKSGVAGLVQACVIVTIVWLFAYIVARKIFKVERSTAMTMSSGLTICGASAAIATAGVAGADKKSLSYIVSVVLIIAVPMIYLMPWLGNLIVPLLTDNPDVQQQIMGAWIGGTVDTTSGVAASSEMAGEGANATAIIVKATQNVLIGVVAFFIALYLSTKGEKGASHGPSLKIVWEKFPKFVLAFVIASLVFSGLKSSHLLTDVIKTQDAVLVQVNDKMYAQIYKKDKESGKIDFVNEYIPVTISQKEEKRFVEEATMPIYNISPENPLEMKESTKYMSNRATIQAAEVDESNQVKVKAPNGKEIESSLAKTLSTLFFSLSFVCIGLDTRLKEIVSKENRNVLYAFLTGQAFNIVATFLVAWLLFGYVKPLLGW